MVVENKNRSRWGAVTAGRSILPRAIGRVKFWMGCLMMLHEEIQDLRGRRTVI